MLTGLTMPQHGANVSTLRLPDAVPRVSEAFRDHGWETAGFVSAAFVNSVFGFRRGFSVFDDATFAPWHQLAIPSLLRKLGRFLPWFDQPAERRAGETMRRALPFLDRPGSKFLWIHLFDPHTDYDPPPGFRPFPSADIRPPFDGKAGPLSAVNHGDLPSPSPSELAALHALYDGEASYADSEIGRLLDEIRRRGLENRTSILLTSDHGEAFGEHGRFLHRSLHQEVLHVPFILWAPGRIPPGLRISEVVRGIDVAPTLADLGGIRWKASVGDSQSVLSLVTGSERSPRAARSDYEKGVDRREDIYVGSSLLIWPWKLHAPFGRAPQLFNLADDPAETKDRAPDQPEVTARLKASLETGDVPGETGPPRVLDPETVRRLKTLGYLQ
jgi:arylsulfatase A-like enzyme